MLVLNEAKNELLGALWNRIPQAVSPWASATPGSGFDSPVYVLQARVTNIVYRLTLDTFEEALDKWSKSFVRGHGDFFPDNLLRCWKLEEYEEANFSDETINSIIARAVFVNR